MLKIFNTLHSLFPFLLLNSSFLSFPLLLSFFFAWSTESRIILRLIK